MNYNISSQARDESWKTLIECKVASLPVKPVQIAAHYGIECHSVDPDALKGASGMIRVLNGKLCMFVNNSQSVQRQRFTVLHELGHFKLGHLGNAPMLRNYESIRPEEEQLADKFAADVLMPACVLWALNIHTAEDIANLCNVSMQAANIRAERMKVLYSRNKFLSHPLERKVYSQFQTFINKVKKPK
jgi:Zn-dependent peptidase ImmA (M78 family)